MEDTMMWIHTCLVPSTPPSFCSSLDPRQPVGCVLIDLSSSSGCFLISSGLASKRFRFITDKLNLTINNVSDLATDMVLGFV